MLNMAHETHHLIVVCSSNYDKQGMVAVAAATCVTSGGFWFIFWNENGSGVIPGDVEINWMMIGCL